MLNYQRVHLEKKWVTKVGIHLSYRVIFVVTFPIFFGFQNINQNSLLWDPSESTDIWTRPQATSCESSSTTLAGAHYSRRAACAVMPVVSITITRKLRQMLLNVICHTTHCVYIYIYIYIIYSITIYARYNIHNIYIHIYIYIEHTVCDIVFRFLARFLRLGIHVRSWTPNGQTAGRSCCSAVSTNPLFADSEERNITRKAMGFPRVLRFFFWFLLVSLV